MGKDEEWDKRSDITIATIRSTAKRESCMRILAYLNNNSEPRTIQEVSENLEMDWGTAKHNLLKLLEAGFVEPEEDKMDGRTKYFKIANKKAVEKAIEIWEDSQRKWKKKEEEKSKVASHAKAIEVEEVF